jgi:hypothetical protein
MITKRQARKARQRQQKEKKKATLAENKRLGLDIAPKFCELDGYQLEKNPRFDLWHCTKPRCNYTLRGSTVRAKDSAQMKVSRILTARRKADQVDQVVQLEIVNQSKQVKP